VGADFLFLPSVEEMYPTTSHNVFVEPTNLDSTSEGIL
jgi:pantothenate synthetase